MKLYLIALSLPLLALGSPVAEAEAEPGPVPETLFERNLARIERRSVTCTLTGSDVRYHKSPSSSSNATGQFGAAGTKVPLSCYTTGSGGNGFWDKIASGKGAGYWITEEYFSSSCVDQLPPC